MKQLSEPLSRPIIDFIERHPPKTLKRNLLSIFIEYVYSVREMIPNDLCEVTSDFKALFLLLDKIEDEIEKYKVSKGESSI
ncbi:hypothetical protein [Chryseobacterium taichungense]|uniref:hypothetical protein n=1 Tax=Chryseobacterium taichungense TaxID=295069 RepID=UPI0028A8F5B7|nr:hypothetical protein [Chryseobacterium taichungense]